MIHGGDRYRNQIQYDFSVNINPMGIPGGVKTALYQAVDVCDCYPDILTEKLRQAISRMTGEKAENILCGNGASELFMAVVRALRPKQIYLPVPSFYGYEWVSGTSDGAVTYYNMPERHGFSLKQEGIEHMLQEMPEDTDMLFLANPNNPVGNLIEPEVLQVLLDVCRERKITVILDECFIEFTEEEERASYIRRTKDYPNLIVVRAFTKLFAIPGVRLGYLVCSDSRLRERIARELPEWNVSVFAELAGIAAAAEQEYVRQTCMIVRTEREFLAEELRKEGIIVFPSAANFLLIRTELPLYERLLQNGILVRDCRNFRGLGAGFYRIAVKKREENLILLDAVRKIKH